MQVIKFHAQKKLVLSRNTYYIPIFTWEDGEVFMKRWYRHLKSRQKIEYISLIKVPDDHPVFIAMTPTAKTIAAPTFTPLCDIPEHGKALIADWYRRFAVDCNADFNTANLPELIIGEPLPAASIKWTKRVKVLFQDHRNPKQRRR